ncbi:MAG: hypothetical protein HRT74_04190 [Flavobacteriales bacterium]|nr:hypothetical protein [Flavobacteriales bacterium]
MHSDLGNDGIYTTVSNDVLGFTTQTYGDFEFAFSRKELRKIKGSKAEFDSVLCYGVTRDPFYEYYILVNPPERSQDKEGYTFMDTLIQGNQIVIAISNQAPMSDQEFILNSVFDIGE